MEGVACSITSFFFRWPALEEKFIHRDTEKVSQFLHSFFTRMPAASFDHGITALRDSHRFGYLPLAQPAL